MLTIGLTGGIGSGKTTTSDLFSKLKVKIIDTDVIAHQLVNNADVLKQITLLFGETILDINGSLNRKKLAEIVFHDKHKKQQLETVLHPKIRTEISESIKSYKPQTDEANYIIVVIPLLFETNFRELINRTLVVIADEKTRVNRVQARDQRKSEEIHAIIEQQVDDKTRRAGADDIIENNSDFSTLESQVSQLHHKYSNLAES